MAEYSFKGGDKLRAKLQEIADKVGKSQTLKVGFLSGSMENKDSIPTAYVAYINEYGGTIPARTVAEHKTTIYRRVGKKGQLLNKGKFVKASKANLITEHIVPEHTIPEHKIPARSFFRRMISAGESHWGEDLGKILESNGINIDDAMTTMGQQMVEELQSSIKAPGYTPNAKSTIAKKGHDQTLIDSSDMLNAVDFNYGSDEE